MREILTLQFGGYSNYVGSHFWNLQDCQYDSKELDMNLLYRTGETESGVETCTPRTVIFDKRGSLGTLRKEGYLYHQQAYQQPLPSTVTSPSHAGGPNPPDNILWNGTVQVHQTAAPAPNAFIRDLHDSTMDWTTEENQDRRYTNLEDAGIDSWSDYLGAHLHPKSIHEVTQIAAFDSFHNFYEGLWTNPASRAQNQMSARACEEAWEQVRWFLEECDRVQGIQIFVDSDSGWAGYASDMLMELKDECRSASRVGFGMDHPYPLPCDRPDHDESSKSQSRRKLNACLSTQALMEHTDLYLPLRTSEFSPRLSFASPPMSVYQSSSVVATAVEIMTSAYRVKHSMHKMSSVVDRLTSAGSGGGSLYGGLAELSCILPYTYVDESSASDGQVPSLASRDPQDIVSTFEPYSLLPTFDDLHLNQEHETPATPQYRSQWTMLRGLPTAAPAAVNTRSSREGPPPDDMDDIHSRMAEYLSCSAYTSWNYSLIQQPIHLPVTYPGMYESIAKEDHTISAFAQVSNSSRLGSYVHTLVRDLKTVDFRVKHEYAALGLDTDAIRAMESNLLDIAESYLL